MNIEDIVFVGAGVAGLTTSLALHRLGLRSLVLELSDSLRVTGYGFVLSANAWRALDAVGIGDSLRQQHPLIQRLQLTPVNSGVPDSTVPLHGVGKYQEVRGVIRKSLLETLEKELPPGTIRFSSKVLSIQVSGHLKLLHLADGTIIKAKVLIGCDGVNSLVAKWLGLSTPMNYTERVAIRGLTEFPKGHGLAPMLSQHYAKEIRYGYVPCDDKTVYWYLTFGSSSQANEELKNNPAKMKQFVLDKLASMSIPSNMVIETTELDNISMCSLKMRQPLNLLLGTIHKGNVCVRGDALHPMTPDMGQGACLALEDAVVLARCLGEALKPKTTEERETEEERYGRIEKGLEKYAKERRWRCFMIVTSSYFMGMLQLSNRKVISFLREKVLSKMIMITQLKITDFDCGKLQLA